MLVGIFEANHILRGRLMRPFFVCSPSKSLSTCLITAMTLLVAFYLREVVMSRNTKKARITRISKVKADRSLEERVTALEKQLTDMQAKASCDMNVRGTIEANSV